MMITSEGADLSSYLSTDQTLYYTGHSDSYLAICQDTDCNTHMYSVPSRYIMCKTR
jgi:hypothetical protein